MLALLALLVLRVLRLILVLFDWDTTAATANLRPGPFLESKLGLERELT